MDNTIPHPGLLFSKPVRGPHIIRSRQNILRILPFLPRYCNGNLSNPQEVTGPEKRWHLLYLLAIPAAILAFDTPLRVEYLQSGSCPDKEPFTTPYIDCDLPETPPVRLTSERKVSFSLNALAGHLQQKFCRRREGGKNAFFSLISSKGQS